MKKYSDIILMPFSGGLDSTYMAYKMLSEGKKIFPIYFELEGVNLSKILTEKQQAQKILSMMSNEFANQVFSDKNFLMSVVLIKSKWVQWQSWIDGLKTCVANSPLMYDVAFGWNQSDLDGEKDLDKFRNRASKFNSDMSDRMKAIFPIFHLNKIEIAGLLPKKYFNESFSCELPLYEKDENKKWVSYACGRCSPCTLQKMLNIFITKKYVLDIQPTDEYAIASNGEHKYHIVDLDHHYINGICPMHMKANYMVYDI